MAGPFYVANVPNGYKVAPDEEISDPEQASIIKGQVLDRNCDPVVGAVVDIWYAGDSPGNISQGDLHAS